VPIGPRNSFNRTAIVTLPGIIPDVAVLGKNAYQIASREALIGLIRMRAAALGLDPGAPDLPRQLTACFTADDPGVRAAAEAVARDFGRGLGYVLLTLKRGDEINRAARSDWDAAHWDHWAGIKTVILGGGLAAGPLGARMADHAAAVLADHGFPAVSVTCAPHAAILPLLGAARLAAPVDGHTLVFDGGHTFVKRGVITARSGQITALAHLPGVPAPCDRAVEVSPAFARHVRDTLADLIVGTWQTVIEAGHPLTDSATLGLSIAAYTNHGRIYPKAPGCYAPLRLLGEDVNAVLAAAISARLGHTIRVRLVHDGTAAATVFTGHCDPMRTVVLMLGTAVGVGYPPDAADLRPIAADCAVT
jgi:hypothetical protein